MQVWTWDAQDEGWDVVFPCGLPPNYTWSCSQYCGDVEPDCAPVDSHGEIHWELYPWSNPADVGNGVRTVFCGNRPY
jgi:hypothetical protein